MYIFINVSAKSRRRKDHVKYISPRCKLRIACNHKCMSEAIFTKQCTHKLYLKLDINIRLPPVRINATRTHCIQARKT